MSIRSLFVVLAPLLMVAVTACGKEEAAPICDEAEGMFCDDCAGELLRCTFEEFEATAQSCNGCQARMALVLELCAAGSDATLAEVDAGMTCEVVDTGAEQR